MGYSLDFGFNRSAARTHFPDLDQLWRTLVVLTFPSAAILMMRLSHVRGRGFHYHLHLRHAVFVPHLALTALLLALSGCACGYLLSQFAVAKSPVRNLVDPALLRGRSVPRFVQQDRNSESLLRFRQNLGNLLEAEYPDSLSKAIAIRHWVRIQQSQDREMWKAPFHSNHENPALLLEEQRRGVPGACRRFAYILLASLLSAGFDARIVSFANSLRRRRAKSHVAVEVWIEELSQWVYLDPTLDTVVLIDGKLASALEVQEALRAPEKSRITFERNGGQLAPHPSPEALDIYCRHLFVATSNAIFDGYAVRVLGFRRIRFLHYCKGTRYPVFRKYLTMTMGAYSLSLSAIFWVWTFLAVVPD